MTAQDIFNFIIGLLSNQNLLVKSVLIILMLLFLLFSLVVARQISLLTKHVNQVTFSPIFQFLAYFVVAATLVLLLAVIFV